MVKASPAGALSTWLVLVWLSTLVIGVVDLVRAGSSMLTGIFFIIYACSTILLYLLQKRTVRKLDQRRQLAASGDQSLLAQEQVVPDGTALPLPIRIKICPKWQGILIVTMITMAILLIVVVLAYAISTSTTRASAHTFFLFLVIALPVIVAPIIIFVVLFLSRRREIEVNGRGMTLRTFAGVQSVSWNEAQLFAIYSGKKNTPATMYELSSARDIVRWTWLRKYTSYSTEEPAIPMDEYNRQMQALLSLIAGRTGLPLYDLR